MSRTFKPSRALGCIVVLVFVAWGGSCLVATAGEVTADDSGRGTNLVRLSGRSLCDQTGPFLGLGASYFQALRHAKYDRARLDRNLALLATNGFNYVRVLSMVNWEGLEIAPVAFTNRAVHRVEAWPDYWQHFRDLLDSAAGHGLRAEVTIFADAQYVMPDRAARRTHLDRLLANIAGHEHQLLHLEVANEAWQNGFPGAQGVADLRAFAQYLAERTEVLVAITSNDDTSDQGIISLYQGSAADLATVHFSRDTRTSEGGWLPVRDCYRAGRLPGVPPASSNEPIGPGSSVASESDPIKLCSAAAFAWIANLPAYVFHSSAVRGVQPPDGPRRDECSARCRRPLHPAARSPYLHSAGDVSHEAGGRTAGAFGSTVKRREQGRLSCDSTQSRCGSRPCGGGSPREILERRRLLARHVLDVVCDHHEGIWAADGGGHPGGQELALHDSERCLLGGIHAQGGDQHDVAHATRLRQGDDGIQFGRCFRVQRRRDQQEARPALQRGAVRGGFGIVEGDGLDARAWGDLAWIAGSGSDVHAFCAECVDHGPAEVSSGTNDDNALHGPH